MLEILIVYEIINAKIQIEVLRDMLHMLYFRNKTHFLSIIQIYL